MMPRRTKPRRGAALRLIAVLAMLLATAGSALAPAGVRAQEGNDTSEPGDNVDGNTYTSPDFGYALTWDRTWDVTNDIEDTNPTYNSLTLESTGSIVILEGIAGAEPLEYIDEVVASIEGDSLASDIEPIEENLDGEVPSTAYSFTYEFDDGTTGDLAYYIQAQAILDGDAILAITQVTQAAAYEAQVGEREDLLEGLSLDGSVPDVETDEPDPEDDPDDDTASGDDADSPDLEQASVPGGDGDRPANDDQLVELIDSTILDINDYWARQFPLLSGGEEYTPPAEWITWTGDIETGGCGIGTSFDENFNPGDGPFYCPVDQSIYYDLNFANYQLEAVPNPFVISAVMAHEAGHHVQEILGLQQCYETPCLDPSVLTSQEIEYMADCFAGSWSADAELRGRLGSSDIDATIVEYALLIGGSAFESADPGGHGRGSERIWWFLNGYVEGAARCLDTSAVTADMLDETPVPDDTPEAGDTPVADETPETPAGTTVGLNEVVDLGAYSFEATRARTRDAIDTEEPDEGQFVVVYFDATIGPDSGGRFDYASWTLTDEAGTVYEVDETATDQLLSSAYEDGIDENLDADSDHQLAMVFDVPADVAGLSLVNESAGVTVELGI